MSVKFRNIGLIIGALLLISMIFIGFGDAALLEAGSCGEDLTWELYSGGMLVISGSGPMYDFASDSNDAWFPYKDEITSIYLKNGITHIGNNAFSYVCQWYPDSNNPLTIPDSVTSIGDYAFFDSYGFTGSLSIPSKVTTIGDQAFASCRGFTGTLRLPDSLTTLGYGAFSYCDHLNGSLTIPSSVRTIGDFAFENCSSFKGILKIPDGVETIGRYAFYGCSGFTGTLILSNTLSSVGENAFECCDGITNTLTIPSSLTEISDGAFSGMHSLLNIDVPENQNYMDIDGVLFTKDGTKIVSYPAGKLANCYEIPNGVTEIGRCAFSQSSQLYGELIFPDTLIKIDDYAFANCYRLSGNLNLPNSLQKIGYKAFEGCTRLTGELVIPNSVTEVGSDAFKDCFSLTGITISNGNTEIKEGVFSGCKHVSRVTIPPNAYKISNRVFGSDEHDYISTDSIIYTSDDVFLLNGGYMADETAIARDNGDGTYTFNSEVKINLNTANAPVKANLKFLGWYTNSEYKKPVFSVSAGQESTILYAKWADENGKVVTWVAESVPIVEPTVEPTVESTIAPTVIATVESTPISTQASPTPFLGLIAGCFGAVALILRSRK